MSYFLKDYSNELLDDITYICSLAEKNKKEPARDNYTVTDWQEKTNTLLYVLCNTNRFKEDNGLFSVIYNDNEPIGFAGAYKHDNNSNVLICYVRTYMLEGYRGKNILGYHVLPHQIKFARAQNCRYIWFTFNEYNKSIYDMLKRFTEGKGVVFGSKTSNIYKRAIYYDDLVLIKGVKQYVVEIDLSLFTNYELNNLDKIE